MSHQLGNHALHCRFGGGTFRRHNRIRDILFQACRVAGLLPELEKTCILPGGQDARRRVVGRWPGGGPALLALDVAVVSPVQATYVKEAANAALTAATAYADRKANKDKTEARCRDLGIRFQPMVVETFGAWSEEARRTIKSIADLSAPRSEGASHQYAARLLFQKLSVALMRENAQTLLDKQQLALEIRHEFRDQAQREVDWISAQTVLPPSSSRDPTQLDPGSIAHTPSSSTPDGGRGGGTTGMAAARPSPTPSAPPSLCTSLHSRSLPVQLESCDAPAIELARAHSIWVPRQISTPPHQVPIPETPESSPRGSPFPLPVPKLSPQGPPSLLSASPPAAHV